MRVVSRCVPIVAAVLFTLTACSGSGSGNGSGPPSCGDTSAKAARLAHGCTQDGKTYKAIVTKCSDGRTMYNVPSAPPNGVSGFSGGTLRRHAVSPSELVSCQTGASASS